LARTLWQASEAPPIDQIPNPRERTLRWEHKEYDYLVCPAAHVEYAAAKPNLRQAASPRGKYLLPQSIEMFPDRNRPVPLTMGQRLGAGTKRPKRECQAQQVNPSLHHGVPPNRPDLLFIAAGWFGPCPVRAADGRSPDVQDVELRHVPLLVHL